MGHVEVWPAFSDMMLAFLLVLMLMFVFQIGKNIQSLGLSLSAIKLEQQQVAALIDEMRKDYPSIDSLKTDANTQEITLGSEFLFAPGNADLSDEGSVLLMELVRRILRLDLKNLEEIQVNGHTDTTPIGTALFPTNWELSTSRASRVVRQLISGGIDPNEIKLVAAGYGEFEEVDASNASRNRRIELRLKYTDNAE